MDPIVYLLHTILAEQAWVYIRRTFISAIQPSSEISTR